MSIWNKNPQMVKMLNRHYNLELKAANLYVNFASIAKGLGYEYLSRFFYTMSKDKIENHLSRILDYFLKLDLELTISPESIPPVLEVKTIQELAKTALNAESSIRNYIGQIANYALEIKDHETYQQIGWFVNDAIEDLGDIDDINTYINTPNANLLSIETAVRRKKKKEIEPLFDDKD